MEIIYGMIWIGVPAILCYVMANNRGRNPLLGIVGGLVFGFFAILYYWAVGDTTELRLKKGKK